MRVLFAGTPAAAVPSLDALAAAHDVAAVLTRPDAAQGRSGALVPSPVKQRALELGLDVHTPRTLRDGAFLPVLADLTLDLACVVAYGNLIPQVLLDVVGWVNLHFSLLPAYRGAAPVQAAIAAGEEVTGASVFALEAGMDTGPVYGHLTEQIGPADTAGTLLERLSVAGAHLLADVTSGIGAGALVPVPQRGEPTYAPKVTPADAAVDWHLPSFAVDRRIRAYTPEPGPYATLGGVRVGLGPVTETDITLPPGRIEAGKREVLVGTGTRAVRLSTVHPAGKREMSAADWARGAHPESFDGVSVPKTARDVAFDVMQAVETSDAYANLLLGPATGKARLSAQDAAFATELTYGTLRMRGHHDAVIELASNRPVSDIDTGLLTIVRMGTHQLLSMAVADHAAVSTSVDLARSHFGAGRAGFVNAVLRTIARGGDWDAEIAKHYQGDDLLAVRTSHPAWIVRAYQEALAAAGRLANELEAALAANNVAPAVTLAARPGLLDRAELPGTSTELSPYGVVMAGGNPGSLPQIRDGRAGVQDEGSQLAALAVVRAQGADGNREWLDMCAGPGGKAALLASLAGAEGAHLTAVELAPHRADLVRANLRAVTEAYPDAVTVVQADAIEFGGANPGRFAKVLLDAPCTGLGALRRRPEARWRRQPTDLAALTGLQRRLLRAAAIAVAPGGVIAYVTCSPHIAETRLVIDWAIRTLGLGLEDASALLPGTGPGPAVQLWPHITGTDAMFIAILRAPSG